MTPDGSYEFLKMLFGMINSAATLKRAMKKLLHGLDKVEFYWGDISVHTHTWGVTSRRFEGCLEDY